MNACKFAAPQQRDDQNAAARQRWSGRRQVNARARQWFKRAATGDAIMQEGLRGVAYRQTCMDRHSFLAMPPWRRIPLRWSLPLTTTAGNQATLKAL